MKLKDLQLNLLKLATLKEEAEPVLSCYLSFEPGWLATLEEQFRLLRADSDPEMRSSIEEAFAEVRDFASSDFASKEGSFAAFARGGASPFFLGIRLRAPLPTLVSAGPRPRIYPLVEVRDNYDHYVLLHVTAKKARIIEVDLGAATGETSVHRPSLRHREGREWTRSHLESHRNERTRQLIKDAVRRLSGVMASGWYRRFILTGDPRAIAEVRKTLSKSMTVVLLDSVPASASESVAGLVSATIGCFKEHEELESRRVVAKLLEQLNGSGQAVTGAAACLEAIQRRQVNTVVMSQAFAPGAAWSCLRCGLAGSATREPSACLSCGGRLHKVDWKEEIVRAAVLNGCDVEIVADSEELLRLGGVGCLLRYMGAEQIASRMSA